MPSRLMFLELEIRGSLGCPAGKYATVIELVQQGKLNVDSLVSGVTPLGQISRGWNTSVGAKAFAR